jgi:hypothetical protein
MSRDPRRTSVTIAGHLAVGMGLGSGLALILLMRSHPPILQLLLDGSSPILAPALYIGIFAMTFGLGSVVTGLALDETDEQ